MLVVYEIGAVAVEPLPHDIGQIAHRQDIVAFIEPDPVRKAEPFPGLDLFQDIAKPGGNHHLFHYLSPISEGCRPVRSTATILSISSCSRAADIPASASPPSRYG